MPVDLLLEGRPCLVVGGGAVAARKVGHLRAAGATVTVAAADVCEDIARDASAGHVRRIARAFAPRDVAGMFLVCAATNDPAVNRRVLDVCRRRRVLCGSVDAHWQAGDFVTPATARTPRLTLAVSTGGQSCRRARMVKDTLARRVDLLATADLLAVRATWRARRGGCRPAAVAALLRQVWGVHEFAIDATPGRLDVLAVAAREPAVARLIRLALRDTLPAGTRVRTRRGFAALAAPAARDAAARALPRGARAGWCGAMLREWAAAAAAGRGREQDRKTYEQIIRGFQGRHAIE